MTEARDTKPLCAHALDAFSFLEAKGFVSSHQTSCSWFIIDYANQPPSVAVQIGAFFPRYEYYVSIESRGQRIGLDDPE
jgi:hypothetical protein